MHMHCCCCCVGAIQVHSGVVVLSLRLPLSPGLLSLSLSLAPRHHLRTHALPPSPFVLETRSLGMQGALLGMSQAGRVVGMVRSVMQMTDNLRHLPIFLRTNICSSASAENNGRKLGQCAGSSFHARARSHKTRYIGCATRKERVRRMDAMCCASLSQTGAALCTRNRTLIFSRSWFIFRSVRERQPETNLCRRSETRFKIIL